MNRRTFMRAIPGLGALAGIGAVGMGNLLTCRRRISVLEDDPGYRPDAISGQYSALLNGEKVKYCVTADEDEGMVLVHIYENGKAKIDYGKNEVFSQVLRGNVLILRDGLPVFA